MSGCWHTLEVRHCRYQFEGLVQPQLLKVCCLFNLADLLEADALASRFEEFETLVLDDGFLAYVCLDLAVGVKHAIVDVVSDKSLRVLSCD